MEEQLLTPPNDIGAESVVLGSMILDSRTLPIAIDLLSAGDFYRPAHGTIFRAIVGLAQSGTEIDLVTLRDNLVKAQQLEEVGGIEYVAALVEGTPSAANIAHYSKIVLRMSKLRDMIRLCNDATQSAYSKQYDPDDLIDRVQQRAFEIVSRGQDSSDDAKSLGDAVVEALDRTEKVQKGEIPPGLQTGFSAIDNITGGFQRGDLVVLGAAPGCGKTAFALNMVTHAAQLDQKVAVFSREMKPRELGKRVLQSIGEIDGDLLKQGTASVDQMKRLGEVAKYSKQWKVWVDSKADTVGKMRQTCQGLMRQWHGPLDLVVIDYLQLLTGRGRTRAEQVGDVAKGAKDLAMDLQCPVLLLSQFDNTTNKVVAPPSHYNFKESGDVGNAANIAILLWRHPGDTPAGGQQKVWVCITKQRDGMSTLWPKVFDEKGRSLQFPEHRPGTIHLFFEGAFTRFVTPTVY